MLLNFYYFNNALNSCKFSKDYAHGMSECKLNCQCKNPK